MAAPTNFKKARRTPRHDKMHLWFTDPLNRVRFSMATLDITDIPIRLDHFHIKEQVFTGRRHVAEWEKERNEAVSLEPISFAIKRMNCIHEDPCGKSKQNTIDFYMQLTLLVEYQVHHSNEHVKLVQTTSGEFQVDIICEFKPEVESYSQLLGQVHRYEAAIKELWKNNHEQKTICVVAVDDTPQEMDVILSKNDIKLFYLPREEPKVETITP